MEKKITRLILILLFLGITDLTLAQDSDIKEEKLRSVKEIIPGVEQVEINQKTKRINHLEGIISSDLELENSIQVEEFLKSKAEAFGLNASDTRFRVLIHETDELGMQHTKAQQLYRGVPVFGSEVILHAREDGIVNRINGELIDNITASDVSPVISPEEALEIAMSHSGGTVFSWEIPSLEEQVKEIFNDPERTLKPSPELVFAPSDGKVRTDVYQLAYQLILPVNEPELNEYRYFVNAKTGEVMASWSRIHRTKEESSIEDVSFTHGHHPEAAEFAALLATGTGTGYYSGSLSFSTNYTGSTYELYDVSRNIRTYYSTTTNSLPGTMFTDSDNVWNSGTSRQEQGVEGHWAGAQVWDYLDQTFGRNSLDGNGMQIRATVDVQSGTYMPNNAFWSPTLNQIVFGRGDGVNYNPFTILDVVAHEYGHGLTDYESNLIYQGESGALNEAYSDILGISVDFFANPSGANWLLGDGIIPSGGAFRSMSNPNQYSDPDTYGGTHWINPNSSFDNGGVHINSGVANYMFYLLSEGGGGTNDNGDSYSVTGIGIDKAAQIWYRAQTTYFTSSTNFSAARTATLNATSDLYGSTSTEYDEVQNAWHAVGVGNAAGGGSGGGGTPGGSTTIFSDSFESGWGNWNDGGSDATRYGATFIPGESYSIRLRDNSGVASSMTSDAFDLTSYDAVELKFDFYASSMEPGEDFWVRFNGGSGWQTVYSFASGVDFNNGIVYTATLPLDNTQVQFGSNSQFRIQVDASNNADRVYFDAVTVSASSSSSAISGTNSIIAQGGGASSFIPETEEETPVEFGLEQNYPNPFNPTTKISYSISEGGMVSLTVYDLMGQKVATIVEGFKTKGTYEVDFNASALSSGVYIYKLQSAEGNIVRKMTLLK